MATASNHLTLPYSSSSASTTSWDVFLSFYGKDTRRNFTSHLYSALVQAGILTYMDDPELEKGQEISSGLLNAIRGSKIFVVVLSENYAYSRWCLNELVEILACKRTSGHVIFPVFYYVDPSDLRHLKGSFAYALDVHKKRYSVDIIEKWKSALAEIAELAGHHLRMDTNEKESDIVLEIVENVTPIISTKKLHLEEYLVGIDSSVEEIYKKLSMESNGVRAIGICGMGGIGKTTIAKAFYNKYFKHFDISCFVDDLKQHSQGGSYLLPLLQQLSAKLFGRTDYKVTDVKSGTRQLKQFFNNKKALIVVDDLDQSSYSEFVVKLCNLFSAGSRIIFTTRDANLVNQLKEDISEVDIYIMRGLEQVNSLELFSYHAFRQLKPPERFKELTISFIKYAGGLPLAIKILGSSLLGRTDVSFWKDKLAKVQEIGDNGIQKFLQLSYNELGDTTQKAIFLDIAFFFIGRDKDEAVHIFKSCGFFPDFSIPVLVERCLLTVDERNKFQMHNLIRDMGKEVIREEFNHGNGRHLDLCAGDAYMDLQNLQGIQKIEGLIIDQTMSTKKHFSAKLLERMPNLRLLEIIGALDIEGDFKNSFHELRCIRWHQCPWTCLPSSFRPQKLVSLDMQYSELKTLWKGITPSVNLKTINLSYSRNLKIMPDFSDLTLVDKLLLRGCKSLLKFHPSIGHLDLGGCVTLKRPPEAIKQLTTLCSLDLGYCSSLTRLPEQLGDMKCLKTLDASYTSIEQLPDSIVYLKELVDLKLSNCDKLRKLPDQIGNIESLKLFDASRSAIEQLPDSFAGLVNLDELHLRWCKNLTRLPNSLLKLKSLRVMHLAGSLKLKELPEQLGKMQCLVELHASSCIAIEKIPDSIGLLSRLQVLDLEWCMKVRNLPSSIWNLTSLTKLHLFQEDTNKINLPDTVKVIKLESLVLRCKSCLWLPVILSCSSLKRLDLCYASMSCSSNERFSLSKLSNLQDLTLDNQKSSSECSFPELPLNLTTLRISNYATLKMLPDLSSLKQLKRLDIWVCSSLQSLPPLPPQLEELHVYKCTSLHDLPDLSMLKELKHLNVGNCINLKSISLKQSFLQIGQHKLYKFEADTPDEEVAEWFSYKSSGDRLSFTIPPNSGDNLFGIGLWIVYKCKYTDGDGVSSIWLRAVITNKTKGIKEDHFIVLPVILVAGEVQSKVECISDCKMKSGDRIKVSICSFDPDDDISGCTYYGGKGEVKVKMCGTHLIHKMPSFPC